MRIMTHLSQILEEERFAKEERIKNEGISYLQRLRSGEVFILQPDLSSDLIGEREAMKTSSLSEERLDSNDLSRVMDLSSKIKSYAADLASELYLAKALKEHKNFKFWTS